MLRFSSHSWQSGHLCFDNNNNPISLLLTSKKGPRIEVYDGKSTWATAYIWETEEGQIVVPGKKDLHMAWWQSAYGRM